jgi:L-ribulokinase
MKISRSDQTPALGAALFAAVAAGKDHGGYNDVAEAQKVMTGIAAVCQPISRHHDIYKQLYALYRQLHDGFGTAQWQGSMYNVMKDLLDLRDRVRRES